MNAFPNPVGSPNELPESPRAPELFAAKQKWYFELLETCRALAGLPVLVALVLQALDWQVQNIGRGAAVAVFVALILRFFPKLRQMLRPRKGYAFWSALPWLLTSTLAIILIFKVLPDRFKQQSAQLVGSWLTWQRKLEEATSPCINLTQTAEDARKNAVQEKSKAALDEELRAEESRDQCLAVPVDSVLAERTVLARASHEPDLASNVMAGDLMLANDVTKSVLWDRLSVGEKFLGNGFSVPIGADPDEARVPEYLVPNYNDKSHHIWRWDLNYGDELDQKPILKWNLEELLLKVPPSSGAEFKKKWDEWIKDHVSDEHAPVLVRFALREPPTSGCLGRPDAKRVFMSKLVELAPKTVSAAAQSTGYTKPIKAGEPGQKLFIWVYAPEEGEQVKRANWENVLANFGTWIKEKPCEIQKTGSDDSR